MADDITLANNKYYEVKDSGGSAIRLLGLDNSNNIYMGFVDDATGTGSLYLRTGGTNALTIDNSQRVGIGTTSPAYTLDLTSSESIVSQFTGSSGETILSLDNTSTNGDKWYLISGGSGGSFAGGKFGIFNADTTTAVATFTNDGNVGIGVTSPSTPLEVHAESGGSTFSIAKFDLNTIDFPRAGTFRIGYGNSADYDLSIKQAVSSGLVKYLFDVRNNGTDYANNLVLDRGKVGIGTASPSASLHVSGSAILQNDSSTLNFYNTAGAQRAFLQLSGTGLIIDTDSFLEFKPNNTTAMYIDSSGNVGVGTTSPNISGWNANYAVLTIKGDTTNYGGVLELANPDSTGNYFGTVSFVNMDGGSSTVANARISGTRDGVDDASALTFETEPTGGAVTERMRINSGGGINVGSGVLTSSSTDGNIVVDEGIYIGTFNGDYQIRSTSAGGSTQPLYIGNAAIQVSSDERLKTNIVDTSISALDKINQVRVVDFNWNDPSDTSYNNRNARGLWTGVIAQEIVDVFPFAVNAPRNEEDLSIDNDSESIWQVDHPHLVPTLIKALQEADDKIDALTARIEALEA